MEKSLLRPNLIPKDFINTNETIIITPQFSQILQSVNRVDRLRTPGPAKNINEFYDLVRKVVMDFERRENVINDAKIFFTEEEPDFPKDANVIVSFSLVRREPGAFGQGRPFEKDTVKNLIPILREEIEDVENPGYKRAILGYIHDNEIKFTIWARTNKVANERALWFEGIMQEYSWYFTSQGVSRCMFYKREKDFVSEVTNVKMYGRPIHYFVKTETLQTISQKKIELIEIQSGRINQSLLSNP